MARVAAIFSPMSALTVVIPVRNGARFVAEAMASASAEMDPGDELIVVDDGSTDATPSILATVSDPRLRILNSGGRGVSAARNLGVAHARGEHVAFLDHDDLWPAGRQKALFAALRAAPGSVAAYGRIRVRSEADAVAGDQAQTLDGAHLGAMICSGLFRRDALRDVGGFAEDMAIGEDADLYMRLVESGARVVLIDACALVYRRHSGNLTNDREALRASMLDLARRRLARQKARQNALETVQNTRWP